MIALSDPRSERDIQAAVLIRSQIVLWDSALSWIIDAPVDRYFNRSQHANIAQNVMATGEPLIPFFAKVVPGHVSVIYEHAIS